MVVTKHNKNDSQPEPGTSKSSWDHREAAEEARKRAAKTVVEAEKFCAAIVDPPGRFIENGDLEACAQPIHGSDSAMVNMQPRSRMVNVSEVNHMSHHLANLNAQEPMQLCHIQGLLDIGKGVSDDDFFHLTCHIEPSLIHKIEKGEFVELEKLLPKDKGVGFKEESRLEWVQRDGGTYLELANRDSKITGIRHWEQAFRAYATIYCGANPHRAKEIWQYIVVINTAASSYVWDNVYN